MSLDYILEAIEKHTEYYCAHAELARYYLNDNCVCDSCVFCENLENLDLDSIEDIATCQKYILMGIQ